MSEPPRGPALPAPEPVDIGIVAALPIEVGTLKDAMSAKAEYRDAAGRKLTILEGDLAGKRVALVVTGPGVKNAEAGLRRLIAGHRPRWIISAGFAGGLEPSLERGDVVVIREVVDGDSGARLSIDCSIGDETNPKPGRRLMAGTLVTVSGIVRTTAEKASLREKTGADLVDMETYAVARACADRGERFLGVRVVSDRASDTLPPEVLGLMGPTGGYRVGATFAALWNRPSSAKDMWKLYENARGAADRLAEVVAYLVRGLG